MVLGKSALALEAGRDRRTEQLGQALQVVPSLGVVHALARVDDELLRIDQPLRDPRHGVGIGARARGEGGFVDQGLGHVLGEQIHGDLDQRGRAPTTA